MAHRLKANGGACCPCAERVGCDCGAPCTSMECRTRGGTAALVGHSEFSGHATLPPKKYLRKALTGETTTCLYDACGGTLGGGNRFVGSGSCVYDAATGTTTNSLKRTVYKSDVGVCTASTFDYEAALLCTEEDPDVPTCNATFTTSATVRTYSGTGGCCFDFLVNNTRNGSLTLTLSIEDTEAAAIARLLAGDGGTWSGWQTVGAGMGECVPTACCRASWAARGAGQFTFGYQEAEYRVTSEGHAPGWEVTFKVRFYRKPSGAPDTAYALYAEEEQTGTADGDGVAIATGDVPLTQGYDTYAASCVTIAT